MWVFFVLILIFFEQVLVKMIIKVGSETKEIDLYTWLAQILTFYYQYDLRKWQYLALATKFLFSHSLYKYARRKCSTSLSEDM